MLLLQSTHQLPCVSLVHEGVVVGELDEGRRPDRFDRPDLGNDLRHGLDLVARRQGDGARAEVAPPGASTLSLDREPVVALGVEELEPRHGRVLEVELDAVGVVQALHPPGLEVFEQARPDELPLPHHDRVTVAERLGGLRRRVEAADHGPDSRLAVPAADLIRVPRLGRERGQGGQVTVRQLVQTAKVGDLVVLDVEALRRQPCQGEQGEAGQGGDDLASLDEAGQRHAEPGELLVVGADSAEGDERDLHGPGLWVRPRAWSVSWASQFRYRRPVRRPHIYKRTRATAFPAYSRAIRSFAQAASNDA